MLAYMGIDGDNVEYYPERRDVGRIALGKDNHDDVYIKIASLVNRVAYLERRMAGMEGIILTYGEKIDDIEDYIDWIKDRDEDWE